MIRTTKISCGLFCLLVAVCFVDTATASFTNLTGAQLNSDPNANFVGTRTRTVNGNSLDFGMAGTADEGLFFYDMFSAGTFGPGSMTQITVSLNITRVDDDHDVFMGLWDGTNFLATSSFDGDRSSRYDTSTFDGTNFTFGGFLDQTLYNSSFAIGDSFDVGAIFNLSGGATEHITVLPDGTQLAPVTTSTFDWTSDISFVFGLNSAIERTSINSMSFSVVPEPSSLLIAGLACGLLATRRRQRPC